jgi:hypothetical protein
MASDQAVYQSEGLWRGHFFLKTPQGVQALGRKKILRPTYFFCCHTAIRLRNKKKPKYIAVRVTWIPWVMNLAKNLCCQRVFDRDDPPISLLDSISKTESVRLM